MSEYNAKQKNLMLKKLKIIGITNEKDILNIKVSELKKINQNENTPNLTIKDIEILWLMQEAIEQKKLLEFFTDIE
jgi:hypothetical protein